MHAENLKRKQNSPPATETNYISYIYYIYLRTLSFCLGNALHGSKQKEEDDVPGQQHVAISVQHISRSL